MFKEEPYSTQERIDEIRRLRKLREDTEQKLVALSNPTTIGQQMSQMARDGKYFSIELNSDEEISCVVDGPAKEVDENRSFIPVKIEEQRLDADSVVSEDNAKTLKRIKAVKRKSRRNISPEFVNASFSSEYSMTSFPAGSDCSPRKCLETLRTMVNSPSRIKEVGRVLE